MKITVTADNIKKGRRKSRSFCPIALALKSAGFVHVNVGYRRIEILPTARSKSPIAKYRTPHSAKRFIEKFDIWGDGVKPFSFSL